MDFKLDYVVWMIMETFPLQFDSIRSSYNDQKEKLTIEEITVILAKEEDDMRKERSMSILW